MVYRRKIVKWMMEVTGLNWVVREQWVVRETGLKGALSSKD